MTSRHPAVSCACPKCQSERRTTPTPTPAADEREAVARAICALHCTECGYTFKCDDGWREVLPDADAALLALAPIRAQEIAAARAEEQGYRHTQVAALKQVHAAEIRAAEANERARIVAWLRDCKGGCGIDAIEAMGDAADQIERNEHGAGK